MILNENLFEDTKENLNEAYSARWDNMVTYSNPIKQQYADLVNDQIYDALDNIDVLASSKISDLPEQTDFGFDQAERVSKAIANLVRTMTKEYFLFTDLKDESLNEVKIADEIRAKQDTKEMTRRAIKMLKNLGGDYEDLAKEFKDAYGEDPLEESMGVNVYDVNKFLDDIKDQGLSFKNLVQEVSEAFNLSKDEAEDFVIDWKNGEYSLEEAVKLGGGMSLPYDDNYCIFVNSAKKTTHITKINSKKEFTSCENNYGSFVGVEKSLEDAKKYVASFNGPAKDNKVIIDS